MKTVLAFLLLVPALAFGQSNWYFEVDEDDNPFDDNSGFNIFLTKNFAWGFAYYTHIDDPVNEPEFCFGEVDACSDETLWEGQGIATWVVGNAENVVGSPAEGLILADGLVRYYPQHNANGPIEDGAPERAEVVIGEFDAVWFQGEYDLRILWVENPYFNPTDKLYKDYILQPLLDIMPNVE